MHLPKYSGHSHYIISFCPTEFSHWSLDSQSVYKMEGGKHGLSEEELCALCQKCCLALDVVKCSLEMFQTLCITSTSDTAATDGSGKTIHEETRFWYY